jgi:hypothetical protein
VGPDYCFDRSFQPAPRVRSWFKKRKRFCIGPIVKRERMLFCSRHDAEGIRTCFINEPNDWRLPASAHLAKYSMKVGHYGGVLARKNE